MPIAVRRVRRQDAEVAAAHAFGHRAGCAGTGERVEHELARAIKLASNEVPFGPLPAAHEAAAAAMRGANRYPDNDAGALRDDTVVATVMSNLGLHRAMRGLRAALDADARQPVPDQARPEALP